MATFSERKKERERKRERGLQQVDGNAIDRSGEPRRSSPPGGFLYESIVDYYFIISLNQINETAEYSKALKETNGCVFVCVVTNANN